MSESRIMARKKAIVALGLMLVVLAPPALAAEDQPPASPDVTAAMQPYLDSYPKTGMVAIFMVQCSGGDQWAARDLFLKTARRTFR
jgi:hypothetical protein